LVNPLAPCPDAELAKRTSVECLECVHSSTGDEHSICIPLEEGGEGTLSDPLDASFKEFFSFCPGFVIEEPRETTQYNKYKNEPAKSNNSTLKMVSN
jgi:hypothetical protein